LIQIMSALTLVNSLGRRALQARGFASRFISTSVGRVHLLEARGRGDLPPIVLLHGFSSCGVHLSPLLRRLRPSVRHLIAPDMPAHGFSDPPRSATRPEAVKAGLFEALDAAIDEPVVVFGNSMGGFAAVAYALARPTKVRGLVLCSPGGAKMDPLELDRFRRLFRIESHAKALEFIDRLFAKPHSLRHMLAFAVRRHMRQGSLQALLDSLETEHLLEPEQLRALAMPILLMWGRGDRILPESQFEFFREHLPLHAQVERDDHFGHSPYLEHPWRVTRRILSFMSELVPHDVPQLPAFLPLPQIIRA
jgi:pimeloyl-ACP methyl ester carboxylesterase